MQVAFGLRIRARPPIPGLPIHDSGGESADLDMFLDGIPPWAERILPFQSVRYRSADGSNAAPPTLTVTSHDSNRLHLLSYVDGARFLVNDDGTRIWADWPDSLSLEDIAVYLLGPVLGMVLRLRGTACLHASAFVFNEVGDALVGESGAGKSTDTRKHARRSIGASRRYNDSRSACSGLA